MGETKVYQVEGKEVHQIGPVVSVVWNTHEVKETKEIKGEDGLTYRAEATSIPECFVAMRARPERCLYSFAGGRCNGCPWGKR